MLRTTTSTELVCDVCGRTIAAGETWFQVEHAIASGVFDPANADLAAVGHDVMQVCADDYAKLGPALKQLAPADAIAAATVGVVSAPR